MQIKSDNFINIFNIFGYFLRFSAYLFGVLKIIINFAYTKSELRSQQDKVGDNIMAKYTVTYKCGHTAEIQLYGKESERQRKIAWYATIDCPQCDASRQKEIAQTSGLPTLSGSEKQIAWATKLRNNALGILNTRIEQLPEANKSIISDLRDKWIAKETASAYWIDNRFDLDNLRDIVNLIEISTNYKK